MLLVIGTLMDTAHHPDPQCGIEMVWVDYEPVTGEADRQWAADFIGGGDYEVYESALVRLDEIPAYVLGFVAEPWRREHLRGGGGALIALSDHEPPVDVVDSDNDNDNDDGPDVGWFGEPK